MPAVTTTAHADTGAAVPDIEQLADVVARLRRAMRRGARTSVAPRSLSVAQIELLQHLTDAPGARAGELGRALRLAPATVSTLIGQLLAKKALERRPDPHDRRAWQLHVTRSGSRTLARWQDTNREVLRTALAGLPDRDRRAIDRALPALDRLVDGIARS